MKKPKYLPIYGLRFSGGGELPDEGYDDDSEAIYDDETGGEGGRGGNFGNWMKGIGGAASVLMSTYKAANPDTSGIKKSGDELAEGLKRQRVTGTSSLDDLLDKWSNYEELKTDYKASDFYNSPTDGDLAMGAISSGISGAAAGSVGGPWGAVIGGVVGLGSGLIGGLLGRDKANSAAEEAADKARKQALETNAYNRASMQQLAQTLSQVNFRRKAAHMAALGGPINILAPAHSAIGYMQNEELIDALSEDNTKDKTMKTTFPLYAFGGALDGYGGDWTNGLTIIGNGGTHGQNPIGGVPMGVSQDGMPNLVEEGEVVWNDYVFSNRIKVPNSVREQYNLKGKDNMTFAEAVKRAQEASAERPNDPIEQRGLDALLTNLMQEQEIIRNKKAEREQHAQLEDLAAMFADGGPIHIAKNKRGTFTAAAKKHGMGVQEFAGHVLANKGKYSAAMVKKANFARNASKWNHALGGHLFDGGGWESFLRYAPAVGSAIGLGYTLFNKPDYAYAKELESAAENYGTQFVNSIPHVSYTPLGDYLAYKPFDRLFYANELGAQQAATRSAIMNQSNSNAGQAMAALLAAGYNANVGLGKLYRQGEEFNLAQRQQVAAFNRATNQYNSEADLRSQITNAELDRAKAEMLLRTRMDAKAQALGMRQAEDQAWNASLAANLTGLFDNLGNIGWEAANRNMINNNLGLYYGVNRDGSLYYKNAYKNLSNEEKLKVDEAMKLLGLKVDEHKNGGYLTIKNRRRG